jgi:1,4-dihydroxy-2-naphthoyl-CoA hydrolase
LKGLHGGPAMGLADMPGATGASINLPAGVAGATTLECRTNFVGVARAYERVVASCPPLHIGKRTSIWQARITSEAAKNVALVTQTQMVL